jgi:cytochrome P450
MNVICELVGIPEQDRAQFRQWTDRTVEGFEANQPGFAERAARAFEEYTRPRQEREGGGDE